MTTGVGGQIQIAEYNAIQTLLYNVLYGVLGQTLQTQTVNGGNGRVIAPTGSPSTGDPITVAQWNALQADINTLANHTGSATPALTSITASVAVNAGSFIPGKVYTILTLGASPAFTSVGASQNKVGITFTATGAGSGTGTAQQAGVNITESDRAAYLAAATTLTQPGVYYTVGAGETISIATVYTSTYSGLGYGKTLTFTATMTFKTTANASTPNAAAQFFFNSGGYVTLNTTLASPVFPSPGSGYAGDIGTLDTDWGNLVTRTGALKLTRTGNSLNGSGNYSLVNSAIGFANLTSTPTTLFTKNLGDTLYVQGSADTYAISASYNSSTGTLTFTMTYSNAYSSTGTNTPQPSIGYPQARVYPVTGTWTGTCTAYYPSKYVSVSAYYPTTSGSFSSN